MKKKLKILLLLLSFSLTACGTQTHTTKESEALTVVTSFYPVYLLAQAAAEGAEGVALKNMAQPQTGCLHDYELTISDMKLLEGADVLLINGSGMESFLEQAMERYPHLQVVDTSAGIALLEEAEHHHAGEEETQHHHEGNPHLWLSPARAAKQVEHIANALSILDTAEAEIFKQNAADFQKDAEKLLQGAAQIGIPAGEYCAVFHEGFAYFAELFSMETAVSIFADEYQMPSAKELTEAAEEAKLHGVRFFLAADDTGKSYGEVLASEEGKQLLLLDPLTTAESASLSYMERMQNNIEAIERHWKEAAK